MSRQRDVSETEAGSLASNQIDKDRDLPQCQSHELHHWWDGWHAAQRSAAQRSAAQRSAAQRSAAQLIVVLCSLGFAHGCAGQPDADDYGASVGALSAHDAGPNNEDDATYAASGSAIKPSQAPETGEVLAKALKLTELSLADIDRRILALTTEANSPVTYWDWSASARNTYDALVYVRRSHTGSTEKRISGPDTYWGDSVNGGGQ